MPARYTLILGTKNWSSWSLRPYLALRATGTPFAEIPIRLRRPDTHDRIREHSPSGWIPVLKIEEDGKTHTVWDSLAICETLAERHPVAKLWPDDPFVRAEARSYACEMHSGFAALRGALSMDFARKLPLPKLDAETQKQVARILGAWEHALTRHGNAEFLDDVESL